MFDVALNSQFLTPVSEPKFKNPYEFQEDIMDLKVSETPVPNGIPKRALKHLAQRVISLLAHIFNTATSSVRGMLAVVAKDGLISPVVFSLYVNNMLSPSYHVDFALYGRLGLHSHIPQADTARQLPGVIPQ
jgi:hypothetical protein